VLLSRATDSVPSGNLSALDELAAKRAKLQATILLPLETTKVVRDNTVILSPKLLHRSSVAPYSTDNRSISKCWIELPNNSHELNRISLLYNKRTSREEPH